MQFATSAIKRMFRLCTLFPMPPKVFVTCFPKSGSTLLMQLLCLGADMRSVEMVQGHERNEQDYFFPRLVDHYFKRVAYRQHARATDSNLDFLRTLGVRPVVLVRDIFDVVCSFRDHSVNMSLKHSMAYLPDSFLKMDKPRQYDMVIDLALPWYFYFYTSWYDAGRNGLVAPLWLTFSELIGDKAGTAKRVLDFAGVAYDPARIDRAVEQLDTKRGQTNTLMNKGVSGRGRSELSDAQQERIRNFAAYYPDMDFSRIGL